MSGWNGSDRRETLPSNWGTLVKEVWKRDGGQCTWLLPSGKRCPRRGRDVDHRGDRNNHSLWNLRLLCGHHHDQHTQKQAKTAKAARRKRSRRPEEPHPGLRRG